MIGQALRLVRVFNDMPQGEAASKLGISKSYLSELEAGKKKVNVDILGKYQEVFHIPPSSILLFSEKMNDSPSEEFRNKISHKVVKLLQWISEDEDETEERKESLSS
jgi:transcriptional regulator with XRE-family HTH domain